jgi:uncharacterized protein YcbK (DUF882 family)
MRSAHFTESELSCHHCGANECTQELVDALEALRLVIGLPIKINDAYRCPTHNAAVGGVSTSYHIVGMAADIEVEGMTPEQLYREALKIPAFRGIGVSVGRYIHVDVRQYHARWCYSSAGKECPWNPALEGAAA